MSLKHNKKKKRTLTPTQTRDYEVEYSAINHDLTVHDHKHEVKVTEGTTQITVCILIIMVMAV